MGKGEVLGFLFGPAGGFLCPGRVEDVQEDNKLNPL